MKTAIQSLLVVIGCAISWLPSNARSESCDACVTCPSPVCCDCGGSPAYVAPPMMNVVPTSPPGAAAPLTADPSAPPAPVMDASPTTAPPAVSDFASAAPALNFSERGSAFTGSTFAALDSAPGGYIEPAQIQSGIRFRFDAAYGFDRSDRAEFYYTTWKAFGGKRPNPGDNPPGFPDPDIDRQELSVYFEHAFSNDFSVYANLPVIFSDPLRNPNDSGFGDMQVGFKLSLYRDCDRTLTFRLNNFIPTADSEETWVGTGHYSIEPGLLYSAKLSDRMTFQAELRDWIAIGGADDYAGNVLRYGVGLGYDWLKTCDYKVTPVVEVVGWSVLDGQVFEFNDAQVDPTNANLAAGNVGPIDATGDTIVNLKIGARIANYNGGSFYGGWGHSLTGDRWYEDIFRIEYRRMF